jgi:hypothetical protein
MSSRAGGMAPGRLSSKYEALNSNSSTAPQPPKKRSVLKIKRFKIAKAKEEKLWFYLIPF